MRRRALLLLAAGVVALAGCGGDDAENATARELAECLRTEANGSVSVTPNSPDLDYVAADAGDGGILVEWGGMGANRANIAVERSGADAENTETAYRAFAKGFDTNVDELLHRRGNVVILYDKSPRPDESDLIDGCA